jgi:hypothetical protein
LLLAIGYWLLAIGYWLLAIGHWPLVIGYWLLTGIEPLVTGRSCAPSRLSSVVPDRAPAMNQVAERDVRR